MHTIIERAVAYLAAMPPAIQGRGGDIATFNVARVLVKGFGLDESAAFQMLIDWNATNAYPSWNVSELRQKIRSAARSRLPDGYLLNTQSLERRPDASATDANCKVIQRKTWPAFALPSPEQVSVIAELRKLSRDAVELCANLGLLSVATVRAAPCFILHEGRFAQARRLDGKPFLLADGKTAKDMNLWGSEGAFIGRNLLGKDQPVLLVEGVVGLLEAVSAIVQTGRTDWAPLAAVSAGARFGRHKDMLARLRRRHVRIVPDRDEIGLNAAAAWLAELEPVARFVDAVPLPAPFKDLGDILSNADAHQETLNRIFDL